MPRTPCASRSVALLLLTLLSTSALAQTKEPVDEDAVKVLREHGLEKSQVMETLSWICDVHGPRLTGSPNLRRAQKWALKQLAAWGLQNGRLESWGPFGRGWRLDRFSVHVTGENPWPVHAYPKAWSPSLPKPVEAEVVSLSGKSREDIEAMDLAGKIVMVDSPRDVSEPFEPESRRFDSEALLRMANGSGGGRRGPRSQRRGRNFMRSGSVFALAASKKPVAILDRYFKGHYGKIFVSSARATTPPRKDGGAPQGRASRPRAWTKGAEVVPQFTLAVEHYNRLDRLLKKGIPVRMSLDLKTTYFDDDPMEYNVLAEIPGTDPEIGDEVVMLGAHFDSWHSGTGATDNGCGSAVMMEAVRLITELVKAKGKGPRRTIRIALWSGEEQGLRGSRAYVSQHFAESAGRGRPPKSVKPDHAKLAGYFNMDNGTGRVRGVYLQGNEHVAPIFRAWLRPFHDLDAATLTLNNTGGTDHLAFDGVGLPGFQFIQDPVSYSTSTHHSNMDNWDHAVADDLKQAATVISSFVWHTAQRDAMLPRKPLPAPIRRRDGQR